MKEILTIKVLAVCLALVMLCAGCERAQPSATGAGVATFTPLVTPSPVAPHAEPTPAVTAQYGGDRAYEESDPDPLPWDALPAPIGGFTFESYLTVDGSTATRPLSQALAYYMTGITDMYELDLMASHTTTDDAYNRLIYGEADLLLVYAPAQYTSELITKSGVELEITAIGRDALVFLANDKNPVDSLTTAQIRDIYAGDTINWKNVGGEDAPITAFQRTELSGSQTLMRNLVMKERPMQNAPEEYRPSEMGELIKYIAAYRNEGGAIGYSVYYYVSRMYMEPGVKLLAVDGVMPSDAAIADTSYPFVNDFYVAIRKDAPKDSPQRVMYDIMCGNVGAQMVKAMGYVPVK